MSSAYFLDGVWLPTALDSWEAGGCISYRNRLWCSCTRQKHMSLIIFGGMGVLCDGTYTMTVELSLREGEPLPASCRAVAQREGFVFYGIPPLCCPMPVGCERWDVWMQLVEKDLMTWEFRHGSSFMTVFLKRDGEMSWAVPVSQAPEQEVMLPPKSPEDTETPQESGTDAASSMVSTEDTEPRSSSAAESCASGTPSCARLLREALVLEDVEEGSGTPRPPSVVSAATGSMPTPLVSPQHSPQEETQLQALTRRLEALEERVQAGERHASKSAADALADAGERHASKSAPDAMADDALVFFTATASAAARAASHGRDARTVKDSTAISPIPPRGSLRDSGVGESFAPSSSSASAPPRHSETLHTVT
eukprot:TRINITY_DN11443_c0_g1_i1.p1 TRINITY_DN11443_c0_g1~~TRINITY_DN11443_c0_g1_i1.p1  ORF type:complete len:367 (-),score=68.79 TRINITY_DN11443_c0_g1_i1:45-1145(-)